MDQLALTSVLAARGRAFQRLLEGDPVAWTILVVVVVAIIAWALIKKRMNRDETRGGSVPGNVHANVHQSAEHSRTEGDAGRRS